MTNNSRKQAENKTVPMAFLDALSEGVVLVNNSGQIVFANAASEGMFGYMRDKLIGQQLEILIPPRFRGDHNKSMQDFFRQPHVRHMTSGLDLTCLRQDGTEFPSQIGLGFIELEGETLVAAIVSDLSLRRQAEAAEHEQRTLVEALRDSAMALASTIELEEVLDRILDIVGRVVPHETATIILNDQGVALIVRTRGYDAATSDWLLARHISPAGQALLRNIAEDGEVLIFGDFQAGHNADATIPEPLLASLRACICAPIQVRGETIGFINLNSSQPGLYTAKDAERLRAFANQTAAAIQNGRLYTEAHERATYLASLNQASTRISKLSLGLDAALQAIVDTLVTNVGLTSARIWIADANGKELRLGAEAGPIPSMGGYTDHIHLADYPYALAKVLQDRRPSMSNQIQDDSQFDQAWVKAHRLVAFAAYPLYNNERLLAVLVVYNRQPMSSIMPDVLGSFISHAGAAIENARLYTELETYNEYLVQAVEERTAELRHTKERIEAILNAMGEALVVMGSDGRIKQVNPAFELQTGFAAHEIERRSIGELRASIGAVDPRIDQALAAMRAGQEWRGEVAFPRRDGTTYDAAVTITPVRDSQGSVTAHVGAFRDISALKEIERMKDAFVSNVSHELRTPITSLKLNVELLGKNPDRTAVYVARMQREADRLEGLVEDLLRLSRLDQGRVEFNLVVADLNVLVDRYVGDRIPLAESKEQELSFNPQHDLPRVRVDAGLLGQALSVLLTNSLNYTPRGGKIEVRTFSQEIDGLWWVGFGVADNGPGIDQNDQQHLFERFYRGKTGRASGESGTGLGLAIAREIVERHQGRIAIASSGIPGEGAAFTVLLPVEEA